MPNTTEKSIGQKTENWMSHATAGVELLLYVQVFAFEADAAAGDNIYNIGGVALGEMFIAWG